MEAIWNSIVTFVTETVPTFMSDNWLIIDAVCTGIILIALIAGLVAHRKHKRVRKDCANLTEEISTRDNLLSIKDARISELTKENTDYKNEVKTITESYEEKISAVKTEYENAITVINEENSCEITALEAEKKGMEEDFTNKIDELNKTIESLEVDKVLLQTELENLATVKAELDVEHVDILDKNAELNRTVLAYSERYEELEKKYNSLLIENDFLKNYETENTVLIKTLRRLKEDEENDSLKAKEAIVALENRLNKKIDATFEAMTSKIVMTSTKLKNLDADLSNLKRPELSKIAKKLGITNYATWSNEKLIKEIKKYKV